MEAIEPTQTYIHKFQSGNDLKVIVDYSTPIIKVTGDRVKEIDWAEYFQWCAEIFVPGVHWRASQEQLMNLAVYGLNNL